MVMPIEELLARLGVGGEARPQPIKSEQLPLMDADMALEFAKSVTCSIYNGMLELTSVDPSDGALVNYAEVALDARHRVATLFMELHDRLLLTEQHREFEAEMTRLEDAAEARKDAAVAATPDVE